MPHVVIVGAGQAGGRAALALRRRGFEGEITLIGAEALPPYERPPLSKAVLTGEASVEQGFLASQEAYHAGKIDLRLAQSVISLDRARRRVGLADGGSVTYDKLVLATGAEPRRLQLPGSELAGVLLLRTAADALDLKARLQKGPLIVVGGGFIGLEVAASARSLGCEVTVLEAAERILGRSIPPMMADAMAALHASKGVVIRTAAQIEGFEGEGEVTGVRLRGGAILPAACVLIGIGIIPRCELAAAAGLEVDNGILTDADGRTADPDVFAIGDCARFHMTRYGRRVRLESFQHADRHGDALAAKLCGGEGVYDPVPWLWSDQYDRTLQTAGFFDEADAFVTRRLDETGSQLLFALRQGELSAVAGLGPTANIGQPVRLTQLMIEQGRRPSPEDLADPAKPLKKLLKGA